MGLPDALLINGANLQSYRLIVEDLASLHAPGARRGENLTIPGRAGDVYVEKVYAAYSFTLPVVVLPDCADGSLWTSPHERRAQFLTNLREVQELVDDGELTFTRRLAAAGGGVEEMTALGEYFDGLAVESINAESGRALLQLINLDGCWTDETGGKHL